MSESFPNSVLLVDEEPIARLGLARLLEQLSGMILCGEATSPAEARQFCAERLPGLAVVDVEMNGGEGCALIRDLRRLAPKMRVIAFLRRCDVEWLQRSL